MLELPSSELFQKLNKSSLQIEDAVGLNVGDRALPRGKREADRNLQKDGF